MDPDPSKNRNFRSLANAISSPAFLASDPSVFCYLKIKLFEEYVGEDRECHYIAICANEGHVGYKPPNPSSLNCNSYSKMAIITANNIGNKT